MPKAAKKAPIKKAPVKRRADSRSKGKRGELLFCAFLREHGFTEVRRGQQFKGGPGSPDVVCADLPHVHFEVKNVQGSKQPFEWLDQAIKDGAGKLPVVAHRRNAKDFIAILRMSDLLDLMRQDRSSTAGLEDLL